MVDLVGIFNPDTFWGDVTLAESYGLWKMAYINGDSSSESVQFNVTGDLFTLPAGPVGFALHLDDTTTDYNIKPDQTFLDDDIWEDQPQEVVVKEVENLMRLSFLFL